MATLRSLFSSEVTANVPGDTLSPKAPVLGIINMEQDTGVAEGRSKVTVNWAAPTENEEIDFEQLASSFTGAETAFETDFDPINTHFILNSTTGETISASSYSLDTDTGVGTLNADAAAGGNEVGIQYTTALQDLDSFLILRVKDGSETFTAYSDVLGQAGVATVASGLPATTTSHIETLTASENGEDHVYYVFALDDESSPNYSECDLHKVETFPTIPQGLGKTVADAQVLLSWTQVTDDNVDGYNIFRNDGGSLVRGNLEQLNSALIASATIEFDDSDGGTNRVSVGTVAAPVNGNSYTYVVESQDTTTAWTAGTQNTISGQSAELIASVTAS